MVHAAAGLRPVSSPSARSIGVVTGGAHGARAGRGARPAAVSRHASQTVPLIALAPQVTVIRGTLGLPQWTSAATLAAFLSFFPITVSTLRGLQSVPKASLELMDSYAAGWWTTLVKVRFPSAVPYMIPGLKLAATASVIGVIVTEITTRRSRAVESEAPRCEYSGRRSTSANRPPVYAAAHRQPAALGLMHVSAFVVAHRNPALMRNRPRETP